jgi:hypothetical protein
MVYSDKGLPSASGESHCIGRSILGRASATRPELGMVSPESELHSVRGGGGRGGIYCTSALTDH